MRNNSNHEYNSVIELLNKIDDMKCCGNCVYKECPNFKASGYCGTWKMDILIQKEREEIIE